MIFGWNFVDYLFGYFGEIANAFGIFRQHGWTARYYAVQNWHDVAFVYREQNLSLQRNMKINTNLEVHTVKCRQGPNCVTRHLPLVFFFTFGIDGNDTRNYIRNTARSFFSVEMAAHDVYSTKQSNLIAICSMIHTRCYCWFERVDEVLDDLVCCKLAIHSTKPYNEMECSVFPFVVCFVISGRIRKKKKQEKRNHSPPLSTNLFRCRIAANSETKFSLLFSYVVSLLAIADYFNVLGRICNFYCDYLFNFTSDEQIEKKTKQNKNTKRKREYDFIHTSVDPLVLLFITVRCSIERRPFRRMVFFVFFLFCWNA